MQLPPPLPAHRHVSAKNYSMIVGSRSEVQMETVTLILLIPFWHQDSMPELKAILSYFCTHLFSSFFMYRIIISHDGIDDAWLQKPSISKSYHATPSHLFSTTISHIWGWVLTRRQQCISSAHVRYSFTASPDSKVQLEQIIQIIFMCKKPDAKLLSFFHRSTRYWFTPSRAGIYCGFFHCKVAIQHEVIDLLLSPSYT